MPFQHPHFETVAEIGGPCDQTVVQSKASGIYYLLSRDAISEARGFTNYFAFRSTLAGKVLDWQEAATAPNKDALAEKLYALR